MAGRARGATGQRGKRNRGKQKRAENGKKGEGKQGEDTAARGRPRPCHTITGHNSGIWPTDIGAFIGTDEGDDIPQATVSKAIRHHAPP